MSSLAVPKIQTDDRPKILTREMPRGEDRYFELVDLEAFSPAEATSSDYTDASRKLVSTGRLKTGLIIRFEHQSNSKGHIIEVLETDQTDEELGLTLKK